jgi:hypothetical protein
MRRRHYSCHLIVIATVLFAGVDTAAASKCTSLKYSLAGKAARANAKCKARAVRAGSPVDAACLAKVAARLAEKWSKAESAGDCVATGDLTAAQTAVDGFVGQLMAALEPTVSAAVCCAGPDSCWHGLADDDACIQFGGTPGAPGTVCDGATGSCQSPPAGTGQCCFVAEYGVCNGGPALNLAGCVAAGGLDYPFGATCLPNGTCAVELP